MILGAISFAILWALTSTSAVLGAGDRPAELYHLFRFARRRAAADHPVIGAIRRSGPDAAAGGASDRGTGLVGSFPEPRLIGRRVNLSPFVVLVSLSIWSALWGVAGRAAALRYGCSPARWKRRTLCWFTQATPNAARTCWKAASSSSNCGTRLRRTHPLTDWDPSDRRGPVFMPRPFRWMANAFSSDRSTSIPAPRRSIRKWVC